MTSPLFFRSYNLVLCILTLHPFMSSRERKDKADKTILAITDFSKNSTHAILFAAGLFKDSIIQIKLLNVFESPDKKAKLLISIDDIIIKDSETGLKKQSAEIASVSKKKSLKILTYSASGKLKKIIGSLAQSEDISLIVGSIPPNKHPCKKLNYTPFLFMGQSRHPVLMVPENHVHKTVNNILILNLDAHLSESKINTSFENLVNHKHISTRIITLYEKNIDNTKISSIFKLLKESRAGMLIIVPSAGDKLDRQLLDYQIQELCTTLASLLNF